MFKNDGSFSLPCLPGTTHRSSSSSCNARDSGALVDRVYELYSMSSSFSLPPATKYTNNHHKTVSCCYKYYGSSSKMMSSPKDCYGSPPPDSSERMQPMMQQPSPTPSHNNNNNNNNIEPKLRDFAADTPATHTSTFSASNIMNVSPASKDATNNNISQSTKPLMASATTQNNNNNTNNQSLSTEEEPLLMQLPRSLLPHWGALMLCSALCLAAVAAGTPLTMSSSSSNSQSGGHYDDMQIVMAIATLSLMLTFVASACYLLIPAAFVGTLYEVTVVRIYNFQEYKQDCSLP